MRQPRWFPRLKMLKPALWRLFREESGQDLVEYTLLVVLIGIGLIALVDRFGDAVEDTFLKIVKIITTQA